MRQNTAGLFLFCFCFPLSFPLDISWFMFYILCPLSPFPPSNSPLALCSVSLHALHPPVLPVLPLYSLFSLSFFRLHHIIPPYNGALRLAFFFFFFSCSGFFLNLHSHLSVSLSPPSCYFSSQIISLPFLLLSLLFPCSVSNSF